MDRAAAELGSCVGVADRQLEIDGDRPGVIGHRSVCRLELASSATMRRSFAESPADAIVTSVVPLGEVYVLPRSGTRTKGGRGGALPSKLWIEVAKSGRGGGGAPAVSAPCGCMEAWGGPQ